jgi:hypothetical protein
MYLTFLFLNWQENIIVAIVSFTAIDRDSGLSQLNHLQKPLAE